MLRNNIKQIIKINKLDNTQNLLPKFNIKQIVTTSLFQYTIIRYYKNLSS